jgi:hypothetical protein
MVLPAETTLSKTNPHTISPAGQLFSFLEAGARVTTSSPYLCQQVPKHPKHTNSLTHSRVTRYENRKYPLPVPVDIGTILLGKLVDTLSLRKGQSFRNCHRNHESESLEFEAQLRI